MSPMVKGFGGWWPMVGDETVEIVETLRRLDSGRAEARVGKRVAPWAPGASS